MVKQEQKIRQAVVVAVDTAAMVVMVVIQIAQTNSVVEAEVVAVMAVTVATVR